MLLGYENRKIGGRIALCDSLSGERRLLSGGGFYKLVWATDGQVTLSVDGQSVTLAEGEVVALTPQHRLRVETCGGTYLSLLFNSNFYCIHGNDHEVSCNGLLFHGSSDLRTFRFEGAERRKIETLSGILHDEFQSQDSLQEEMLRILLKRFIILCTRAARRRYGVVRENGTRFETIRRFLVLVDIHFRKIKQVADYARMLNKSPKTLSNTLSACRMPSAIRIIHGRIEAEAKRLLLYTSKSGKEIASELGFEDQAAFSRFFKNATGISAGAFRKRGIASATGKERGK